jgi:hypothetical protein
MKKYTDIERVKSVIGSDRLNLSKDYTSLICYDIEKLLEDYFELGQSIDLSISTTEKGYEFTVKGSAIRLKPFNFLPKSS